MPTDSRLLIQKIKDVTIVRIRETSILDTLVIQKFADELTDLVDKQDRKKMILDFTDVKFLSSAALGVLVTVRKKIEAIKGQLVISQINKELRKIFKITNLEKLFTFTDNEEDALAVFGVTTAG